MEKVCNLVTWLPRKSQYWRALAGMQNGKRKEGKRQGKKERKKERKEKKERKTDDRETERKKIRNKEKNKERTIKYIYTRYTFSSSLKTGNLENFWRKPSLIHGNT